MSRISVTRRELQRAYRSHCIACNAIDKRKCKPTYLVMLFYAVECGLKAIWLKRNGKEETASCGKQFDSFGHNINIMLSQLRVHKKLHLPNKSRVVNPGRRSARDVYSEQLNQAWRYGCQLDNDEIFEEKLVNLITWIRGELS